MLQRELNEHVKHLDISTWPNNIYEGKNISLDRSSGMYSHTLLTQGCIFFKNMNFDAEGKIIINSPQKSSERSEKEGEKKK